jgi:UDP-2,4-diacetamido-2,4,6-trideoxy-beta-L-altropyranose hydrolase
MEVVFRVDSSSQMGAGHLMRCLTLADELKKQNHQITFICRELLGNLIDLIKQKKHQVITLAINENFQTEDLYLSWLGSTQEQDGEQSIKVMPKNTDLLIVDNYALDEKWHKQLRNWTKKIMVIDDLANRQFDCDILLNQNLGSKKQDYKNKVLESCQLLLGCDYALLRPEFNELRAKALAKREDTKTIKNILISMGGSDIDNITYDILQDLNDDFNIVVVLGSSSPHNEMIKNYAKNKNIKVIINTDNMAELMLDADLAIGAGGSTSWERCCLGLPTLLYITAENQKEIAQNLAKLGAVQIIKNLKNDIQKIKNEFVLWQIMVEKSKNICDGLGVNKIIALINKVVF